MKNKNHKFFNYVIIAAVLIIPFMYSFFYLKSYWNPYGDLSDIKIAIVNLDKGKDGENQGKEFVSELKEDGTFQICEVKDKEANTGMDKGEYYAKISDNDFNKIKELELSLLQYFNRLDEAKDGMDLYPGETLYRCFIKGTHEVIDFKDYEISDEISKI